MSDREHLHPLALAVLDGHRRNNMAGTEIHAWMKNYQDWMLSNRPLLTARASAVLAAVEEAMVECDKCDAWKLPCCHDLSAMVHESPEDEADLLDSMRRCAVDRIKAIRAAWKEHADG